MRSPLLGLPKSIYYNDMPNRYNDHAHLSENVSHIFQVAVLSVSKKLGAKKIVHRQTKPLGGRKLSPTLIGLK